MKSLRQLTFLAVFLAGVNLVWITVFGPYDFRLGPIHLAAHESFKPLLYLCAALLAAALANSSLPAAPGTKTLLNRSPSPWLIAAVIILLYLPCFNITIENNDWTHQADVSAWNSFRDFAHLFVWRQPDGFYRPLVFVSLWADYLIFGDHEWGYHIQNILFHVTNCLLWIRLAMRLGIDATTARWSGLLFAVAAVNCEPVIWPGARFDLVAACFTIGALLFTFDWWRARRTLSLIGCGGCYVAAVCSKESAYCFPLLVGFFLLTPGVWKLQAGSLKKRILPLVISVVLTIVLLLFRWVLFHGMGGYPGDTGNSPHFNVRFSTFTSFFTRALPVPLLALNTNSMGMLMVLSIVLFAAAACVYAALCDGTPKMKIALLAAALLSALPAVNLVDWINPIMWNTRYLYMPSLWIWLLISIAATGKTRKWLWLFVLANLFATIHDYRNFSLFVVPAAPL